MGGVLAAYTLGGFFIAPPVIKSQVEQRGSALLGRTVTVGKVRVNPWAFSVTLEDFAVRGREGQGSFLGWKRLYVNAEPVASLVGPWTLAAVELDDFEVKPVLEKDGDFNFADILARLGASGPAAGSAAPAASPPALRVGSVTVQRARVEFADKSRSRPFATTLGPVSFNLTDFHTAVAAGAPYRFEAVTEAGERLTWSGKLSAAPVASSGELRLENIFLPKYAPYYADFLRADLTDGFLSLSGHYEAKFGGGSRKLELSGGSLQLAKVKLIEQGSGQPLLDLPSFSVFAIIADALAPKVQIGTVGLRGGQLNVRREADGSLNLLKLLGPARETGSAGPSGSASKLPEVEVREVNLGDFQVVLEDVALPHPATHDLKLEQLSLLELTLADGAEIPLRLFLTQPTGAKVKVAGKVTIKPELKATLQVDVAGLALPPLSPYLEQFVNARLTQGTVSTNGMVTVAMAGGTPAVTFDGNLELAKLGLVDAASNEELAGFASLAFSGIKAVTAPQLAVSLAEVNIAAPYARVLVNKDGTINLAGLAKGPAPASATVGSALPPASAPGIDAGQSGHGAPPTPDTNASRPRIAVAKVVVADGDFSFTDRSLEPNVRMGLSRFGGTVAGLSSENLARGEVDLKAAVNGAGPVAITGQLDPLGARKFVDLKVDFKNVDLVPLSPYSGKYAGYALARGQLNLDVRAKLDDKRLDASNVITLDQFTFGAPVASPDATKLPVRLGVSLLKDMNGRIVIDVPMAGNIEDPELRIGKVVLRVVVNLLTKAAVSPFALVGSMFGGGGDELAFQEFAPGASELLPAESAKLATMVKALAGRPGLSLGIEGGYDGPVDTPALQQRKFAALVRGRIWEERHAADPTVAPPGELEIAAEAHAAMVKKLFDEKFPPGTELGAPPPPPVAVAVPPPAEPKKGFLRRVVDVVTFKGAEKPAMPLPASAVVAAPAEPPAAGPSVEEMTARLAAALEVTDNDLRALAEARARRVREYFLTEGKIGADRLFLASDSAGGGEKKGPRVFLSLR